MRISFHFKILFIFSYQFPKNLLSSKISFILNTTLLFVHWLRKSSVTIVHFHNFVYLKNKNKFNRFTTFSKFIYFFRFLKFLNYNETKERNTYVFRYSIKKLFEKKVKDYYFSTLECNKIYEHNIKYLFVLTSVARYSLQVYIRRNLYSI